MTEARFWDRLARKYAKQPIADPAAWEATLARARAFLDPGDRVLELGCGTGGSARKLAGDVAHVTATDISAEMIAIAEERCAKAGISTIRHRVLAADAEVPGAPFDAVIAFNLLHLVPHLDETLSHIHHLLRPGGVAITKTPCIGEMGWAVRLLIPVMQAFGKAPRVLSFTRSALEAAFRVRGFTIEETGHFGKDENAWFVVARKPGDECGTRER